MYYEVTIDTDKTFTVGITTVGDTLGGLPVDLINKNHDGLSDYSMDNFNVDLDASTLANNLSSSSYSFKSTYGATESTVGGGNEVMSTRNIYYDALHTMIPSTKVAGTQIFASC